MAIQLRRSRRGGTGALIIGDVGQSAWEEIDYEPRGARRTELRLAQSRRRARQRHVAAAVAAAAGRSDLRVRRTRPGSAITGGFVYRGAALPRLYAGRYFFADFVSRKVWSIALTIDPSTRTARASDLRDHSGELGSPDVTSFGTDAAGELYFTSYEAGTISRITADDEATQGGGILTIEDPSPGGRVSEPFIIAGWAIDADAVDSSGIDQIQAWAVSLTGHGVRYVGTARLGLERQDVADAFGSQFSHAGFALFAAGLPPDRYRLFVLGLVHSSGTLSLTRSLDIVVDRERE